MRNFSLTLFCVLCILKVQAQDYLISFAAEGDTSEVSTVLVDNLSSGATVTLNGADTLHLIAAMGIGPMNMEDETLQIFPNPMVDHSTLTFFVPESGAAVLRMVGSTGQTVYQMSTMLSHGAQCFRISGVREGIYIVKVNGKNYSYTTKLISLNTMPGEPGMEHISSPCSTIPNPLKSATATIIMPYTDGDLLMFKGISGPYSTLIPDIPVGNKIITFNFVLCQDIDGNNYTTVKTGTQKSIIQIWMAENLRVTHYRNGDSIPNVTNGVSWNGLTTGAYCWYNNDETSNKILYGALYNWHAVQDNRNLCPTGWHVPLDEQWTNLTTFLGGEGMAGGKMKSIGTIESGTGLWYAPNTGATNGTGFSSLPGGYRYASGGFGNLGYAAYIWSSAQYSSDSAWNRALYFNSISIYRIYSNKKDGLSVRCLHDN